MVQQPQVEQIKQALKVQLILEVEVEVAIQKLQLQVLEEVAQV